MEGAILAEKKAFDLAIVTAWHTAIFGLNGYAGKLVGKSLSDYLISDKPERTDSGVSQAISFFHRMKLSGLPVEITKTQIN